jgi:Predicted membrane protein
LTNKELILIILACIELVMSLVTVILYKNDKVRAKKRMWRTKESLLLILPWLMGGLGGFMGVYSIRHKTQHWYFPLNNVLALITQASLFISLAILL